MADVITESYAESNRFAKVIFQRAKDVIGFELNEAQDNTRIDKYRSAVNIGGLGSPNDGLNVEENTGDTDNKVKIVAGDFEHAGVHLLFTADTVFSALTTAGAPRTDTIWASITEQEVADPNQHPDLGETTVRRQTVVAFGVAEGVAIPTDTVQELWEGGTKYVALASIARATGVAAIVTADITDLRRNLPGKALDDMTEKNNTSRKSKLIVQATNAESAVDVQIGVRDGAGVLQLGITKEGKFTTFGGFEVPIDFNNKSIFNLENLHWAGDGVAPFLTMDSGFVDFQPAANGQNTGFRHTSFDLSHFTAITSADDGSGTYYGFDSSDPLTDFDMRVFNGGVEFPGTLTIGSLAIDSIETDEATFTIDIDISDDSINEMFTIRLNRDGSPVVPLNMDASTLSAIEWRLDHHVGIDIAPSSSFSLLTGGDIQAERSVDTSLFTFADDGLDQTTASMTAVVSNNNTGEVEFRIAESAATSWSFVNSGLVRNIASLSAVAPVNSIVLDSAGDFGLGLASPLHRFHLQGSLDAEVRAQVENTSDTALAFAAIRASSPGDANVHIAAFPDNSTATIAGQALAGWGYVGVPSGEVLTEGLAIGALLASADVMIFQGNTDRARFTLTALTINAPGGNYDFIVEGDTDTTLFRTDADQDQVVVGTSSTLSGKFVIVPDAATDVGLRVDAETSNGGHLQVTPRATTFGFSEGVSLLHLTGGQSGVGNGTSAATVYTNEETGIDWVVGIDEAGGDAWRVWLNSKSTPVFSIETSRRISMTNPGGAAGAIRFGNESTNPTIQGFAPPSSDRRDIMFDATGIRLLVSSTGSAPSATNGIIITEAGDVGIAKAAPDAQLDILQPDSSGNALLRLSMTGDTRPWVWEQEGSAGASDLLFRAVSGGDYIIQTDDGVTSRSVTSGAGIGTLSNAIYNQRFGVGSASLLSFDLNDAGSGRTTYASVEGLIVTNTAGSEDGALVWRTVESGTNTERLRLRGTGGAILTATGSFTLEGTGVSLSPTTSVTVDLTGTTFDFLFADLTRSTLEFRDSTVNHGMSGVVGITTYGTLDHHSLGGFGIRGFAEGPTPGGALILEGSSETPVSALKAPAGRGAVEILSYQLSGGTSRGGLAGTSNALVLRNGTGLDTADTVMVFDADGTAIYMGLEQDVNKVIVAQQTSAANQPAIRYNAALDVWESRDAIGGSFVALSTIGYTLSWGASLSSAGTHAVSNGEFNSSSAASPDFESEHTAPRAGTMGVLSWNTQSADATTVINILVNAVVVETVTLSGVVGTNSTVTTAVSLGDQITVEYDSGTAPMQSTWVLYIT